MKNADVIGIVLAGGLSSRMQGQNKAEIKFEGQTLVARAVDKLSAQVAEVCLSASHSYGLDIHHISDTKKEQGPLAGIYAALTWVSENRPNAKAILTVPVDAPFFPDNLCEKLMPSDIASNSPVVAATADGMQPTFTYWPIGVLSDLKKQMGSGEAGSLKAFAKKMGASKIMFEDPQLFFNVNSQADLKKIL